MKPVRLLLLGAMVIAALALSAAAGNATGSEAASARQDVSNGAVVYQAACASCHQANGVGIPGTFPPLAGNPKVADSAYVESVIRDGLSGPITVLGVDYNAAMPAVAGLSDGDIADVIAYVQSLDTTTPTTTVPAGPPTGDADHGERLFNGRSGFTNGGAACHACHSAGAIGFRGGSGLGPDLTDVYDRFGGEPGLSAWLTNPASPTMQPLFVDKPLTEPEVADLVAFLGVAREEEPAGGFDMLLLGGGVGLILLLGLMALVIRGPQETYNQRLRRQQ